MFDEVGCLSKKNIDFRPYGSTAVFHFGIFVLTAIAIALFNINAYAARVEVTFQPSPDSRTIGHYLYYSKSENLSKTDYFEKIDLANETRAEIGNLQNGATYYFAASAYAEGGDESAFCKMVPLLIPEEGSGSVSDAYLDGSASQPPAQKDLSSEGTADWTHWGLADKHSFNGKQEGGQIGDFTPLTDQYGRFGDARTAFSWNGGAPTANAAGTTSGLYFPGVGNGYELSVQADASPRLLRLYLGGWNSRARLEVSLSDGSAPPYVVHFENSAGIYDRVVTLDYAAASDGQALLIRYQMEPDFPDGNITLIAATLQADAAPGVDAVATPAIYPSAGTYTGAVEVSIEAETAGADIYYTTDGSEPTAASPQYAGPFTLAESATVKARGFLEGYAPSQTASSAFVVAPSPPSSSDAYLDGSASQPPAQKDLSSEGTADWTHWGLADKHSFNGKQEGGQIGDFTPLTDQYGRFGDARTAFSWNGGAPTANAAGTTSGLYFPGVGNGYELSVQADASPRLLRLYLGGWNSRARLEVSLSDGSAPPYVVHFENSAGIYDRVVTLDYAAASDGQALLIRYQMEPDFPDGNITLIAATLQATATMEDFESYSTGEDPSDWLDTLANNSMMEDDNLFKVFTVAKNNVLGTNSTESDIHSHHTRFYIENLSSFEYSGRMMLTSPDGGIGVTFLSHYPFTDTYYRLGNDNHSSFHIESHPKETLQVFGTTDTGIVPSANLWYRFRILVRETGVQTEILAKVWPENTSEPPQWQIDAYDDTSNRLVSGTFGVWSDGIGKKYWDDLIFIAD